MKRAATTPHLEVEGGYGRDEEGCARCFRWRDRLLAGIDGKGRGGEPVTRECVC